MQQRSIPPILIIVSKEHYTIMTDATKLCNMLSRIDWADAIQNGSIDDCADHFNAIFLEAACNCIPLKPSQFALKMLPG